ncbi:MAG: M12 family metallo-peptidase [Planctomycetota bacterium]
MLSRSLVRGLAAGLAVAAAAAFAQPLLAQDGPQSPIVFDDLVSHTIERLDVVRGQDGSLRTTVMLGAEPATLILTPHSVRTPDFEVLIPQPDGSLKRVVAPAPTTYRGRVVGMESSTVVAGFFRDGLTAEIYTGEGEDNDWIVQPLRERVDGAADDLHVVHRRVDDISLDLIGGVCGTPDDPFAALQHMGQPDAPGVDETLVLDLAVDTDFEFYQLLGSSEPAVIAAIENQVNAVSRIYERDVDTVIQLGTVIVRDSSSDPYTTSDGGGLLGQMRNHWRSTKGSIVRDTASLMSGRDFAGGVLGVAYLSGLCSTTNGYNVNQYRNLSVAARVAVHAHEIGHNCSAPHCSGGDCRIMCAGIGGCSGDIFRFGNASKATIRSFLERVPCIDPLVVIPDPLALPFEDGFDASDDLDPMLWTDASEVFVSSAVVNPISSPNALGFRPDGTLSTVDLDVPAPGVAPTYVKFWTQARFVEAGKSLRVEYFSTFSGTWEEFGSIVSDGTTQDQYVQHEFEVPLTGVGNQFRLRLTAVGTDIADVWFVDSVVIDEFCRADLNSDGALNIFDFLGFQTFFDLGDPRADFNSDTRFDVFDFLAYQNAFTAGCY